MINNWKGESCCILFVNKKLYLDSWFILVYFELRSLPTLNKLVIIVII